VTGNRCSRRDETQEKTRWQAGGNRWLVTTSGFMFGDRRLI
jgi:hypothetical protein